MKTSILLLPVAALLLGFGPPAISAELAEDSGLIPVTIGSNTVRLEGLFVKKADARERLPIAIITNGGTLTATAGLAVTPQLYAPVARDLARRGWLAAVVLRRGFGQSEGAKPRPIPCEAAAFNTWASAAADDLQAAMQSIAQRPDADPDHVIVISSMSGGVAAVALAARNPRGLVGVISIAGGLQSESKCPLDDILTDAFGEYGAKSRVANLWIYARSDKVFPPSLTDRWHVAFLDGGGDVKFVQFHIDGDVGNTVFSGARRQWFLQMDGFLRAHKLPTWTDTEVKSVLEKLKITHPMMREVAHSGLSGQYFSAPGEKALAFSFEAVPAAARAMDALKAPSLPWAWTTFSQTLDAARKSALESCAKKTGTPCTIVMENNQWVADKE